MKSIWIIPVFVMLAVLPLATQNAFAEPAAMTVLYADPLDGNNPPGAWNGNIFADDFVLTLSATVTGIHFHSNPNPFDEDVIYTIYENNAGQPGTVIDSGSLVNTGASLEPEICARCYFVWGDLPIPLPLAAGTYWVGLTGNAPSSRIILDDTPVGASARLSVNGGVTWQDNSPNAIPLEITGHYSPNAIPLEITGYYPPDGTPVGGTLIPIDMTSLLLASTQMNVVNYNEDLQVPSWFVNMEKWFKDGNISDSEFFKATQYLKNTNIITEIKTELKSAAIIDQLHDSIPNPEFQQKTKQYMQESGYKVDIYTTDDITVDFYKQLPSMNYDFIYIRTHSLGDPEEEKPTFLFTGEKYDLEKYTNEQLFGQVAHGSPIYEQELNEILKNEESLTDKTYFLIGSKMIEELMVGSFPQSVIIIGGCESLGSYDLANSLISRGASAVIGWSNTINSDENDEAMLSFLELVLSENYDIPDAARLINEKYSPDMEFSSKLKGSFNSDYNYLLE